MVQLRAFKNKEQLAIFIGSANLSRSQMIGFWCKLREAGGADPCVLQLNFTSNYAAKAACQISGIVALRPPSFPI